MFHQKEQIIVGLEIGTSKVCAVVGELLEDGNVMIIGVGQAPSQGVRKGELVHMESAEQAIHEAVKAAEESAGVEIHTVNASVTGGHLRCFNNRGSVAVMNEDREISHEEIHNVMLNAKAVNIPMDHVIVHAIRQRFYVDGHDGIQNPVGMVGAKLEADVHVIHGIRTRLQNTIKAIKEVSLDIDNVAVSSVASALAVLTSEHQHLGAVVIDMGGGTTDYIVYHNGTVQHSGVLAVGGDHITNDIAVGLRIPMNRAERLKLEFGSADWPVEDSPITIKREVGLPDYELSRRQLCQIIHLRVEETLMLVKTELERQGLLQMLGAGVFITGGCARLPGMEALAGKVFGLPVHIGHSLSINGPTSAIESPEYSTAIGLLRYAVHAHRDNHHAPTFWQQFGSRLQSLLSKVKVLLY
jgi:cell division protein FtsA